MPKPKKKPPGTCPFGKPAFATKEAAAKESSKGAATRCGRCRQWHPA